LVASPGHAAEAGSIASAKAHQYSAKASARRILPRRLASEKANKTPPARWTFSMEHYKKVSFEYVSASEDVRLLHGVVIMRPNEMVLEIELPGDRPYFITGAKRSGFYEGVHKGQPDDIPVHAKWTKLDNAWIGTWVEGGMDYLFTFETPAHLRYKPDHQS
jgi:hypothetical protein